MKIVGFGLDKISGEKKKPISGKLEVKSNLEILEVKKAELELMKKEATLKFSFRYSILYEPGFAELVFEGFIVLVVDESKSKDILKEWKKKKVEDDVRVPLFNIVMTKCNIKALQIEEELSLPTHIPMPRIQPPQN